MRINERRFGDAAILDLHGPVVGWEATTALDAAVDRHAADGRSVLVVNLADVHDIDSRGLAALVGAHGAVNRAGGELRLAGVTRRIRSLVVLSRLLTFFDTYETVEDAVADLRAVLAATAQPLPSPAPDPRPAGVAPAFHFPFWPGMHRLLRRA